MPQDQPANPRIRTKVLKLDTRIDDDLFNIIEELRLGQLSVEEYQRKSMAFLEGLGLAKTFARDIAIAKSQKDQHWLVRRHTQGCRYTLMFFNVDENEVHPPHQHHNLISTQVVIEGKIQLREYQRLGRDENGQLKLQLVRDDVLGPGEVFQASEWHRNVHWFCAIDGPAVLLNINIRGYENEVFAPGDDGPFGRRYLDPGRFGEDGVIICEDIDEAESERRFQGRRLSEFPAPAVVETSGENLTINI